MCIGHSDRLLLRVMSRGVRLSIARVEYVGACGSVESNACRASVSPEKPD